MFIGIIVTPWQTEYNNSNKNLNAINEATKSENKEMYCENNTQMNKVFIKTYQRRMAG